MIKQNGARYQIIRALAEDGMLPASELAEKTSLTAGQVLNNCSAAKQSGLIVSVRDDVTGLRAWKLTTAGRDWWAANKHDDKKMKRAKAADKPGVSVHETTPAVAEAASPRPPAVARPENAPSAAAGTPPAADGGDGFEQSQHSAAEVARLAADAAQLREHIETMERVGNLRLAELGNLRAMIAKLEDLLRSARAEADHLRGAAASSTTHTAAPYAYLVRAHRRKLRIVGREDTARAAALAAIRGGARHATVYALVQYGTARFAAAFLPSVDAELS